ncbi:hypothetical protein BN7_1166 [Wickerhamomyces ciferrii]|uniref:Uncharacterized protein n=1 Tax=Wickerhamomyces ciferrii (strain ATCC 14091 / BCRC 22168 / CBS 111 / JCM 3599 / NBRC 0793 / NRRL Y-1031 F-60-10) TaxID=1206466 RepID=K0K9N1_WICCF|nr:uncharacterized protein BN7_1166 [Wickerhamomyces ciferrii]CCH41625.1 hypothetical protein BN7_1166 [Wickerhamomyces ciferrii]
MDEEEIPPSDDEGIFLSTQIQGKLDDLDQETKKNEVSDFLQKFALKTSESSLVSSVSSSSSSIPTPRPPLKVKKNAQPKITKPKPKKKAKKLSVTDQMIRKLSGKPQKFRQMQIREPTTSGDLLLKASATSSFNSDDGHCYDSVFTPNEWRHLKYTFKRKEIPRRSEILHPSSDCTSKLKLWEASTESPDFDMNDWNSLYGYHSPQRIGHVETEISPAITFSQAFRSSQDGNYGPPDDTRIVQNDKISPVSSFSEVGFSSDEGSIIEVEPISKPRVHHRNSTRGTLDDPIELLSSQSSIISNISKYDTFPQDVCLPGEVKYKGQVKMNSNSQHIISPRQKDQDEIPDSSDDDDDITHIIQIVRRDGDNDNLVWEISCSSDDDDF